MRHHDHKFPFQLGYQKITIAILIGGLGRRMGGQDKSLLTLAHNGKKQTFLERLIEEVAPFDMDIVLSGRPSQFDKELTLIEDRRPNCGPLGGLYSVLTECPNDWVFLLACDLPFFEGNVLRELLSIANESLSIVLPVTHGCNHPTAALYHRRLRPILQSLLEAGTYSFKDLFAKVETKQVFRWEVPKKWEHAFRNINHPDDLDFA